MWRREVVQSGENFIHQVEIDLPQAERIDAPEIRPSRRGESWFFAPPPPPL